MSRRLAQISESPWFAWVITGVILLNAAVLGAETYEDFANDNEALLETLNRVFLGIFAVEIAIRVGAYGSRPQDFFRSGWNVFDFVVVAVGFAPGAGQNATVLRLARLARVLRVISVLPELRVLVSAVGRAIPPIAGVGVLAVVIVYAYGIVGWILFGDEIPERWGDIGTAMLTLFVMLTLENLPQNLEEGMDVHSWSWIYFVSFALTASLVLLNFIIGIVINSMEQARAIEHEHEREARRRMIAHAGEDAELDERERDAVIAERFDELRLAVQALELELRDARSAHGRAMPGRRAR